MIASKDLAFSSSTDSNSEIQMTDEYMRQLKFLHAIFGRRKACRNLTQYKRCFLEKSLINQELKR